MKAERLPYTIQQIAFPQEGAKPQFTAYSSVKDHRMHLPVHFTPKTNHFLKDVIDTSTYEVLPQHQRDVLFTYLFTQESAHSLARKHGQFHQNMYTRLKTLMIKLWTNLPPELGEKYTREQIRKLKNERRIYIIDNARKVRLGLMTNAREKKLRDEAESSIFDYSPQRRKKDPKNGAIMNIKYMQGPHVPCLISDFYLKNIDVKALIAKSDNGTVVYFQKGDFYIYKGGQTSLLTTEDVPKLWQEMDFGTRIQSISKFGHLSKDQLKRILIDAMYGNGRYKNGTNGLR